MNNRLRELFQHFSAIEQSWPEELLSTLINWSHYLRFKKGQQLHIQFWDEGEGLNGWLWAFWCQIACAIHNEPPPKVKLFHLPSAPILVELMQQMIQYGLKVEQLEDGKYNLYWVSTPIHFELLQPRDFNSVSIANVFFHPCAEKKGEMTLVLDSWYPPENRSLVEQLSDVHRQITSIGSQVMFSFNKAYA